MADADDAVSRVIRTPELLESVLLQLDRNDPGSQLRCQRVSKTFQATIAGSIELQQILCFAPNPDARAIVPESLHYLTRQRSIIIGTSVPYAILQISRVGSVWFDAVKPTRRAGEKLVSGSWQRMLGQQQPGREGRRLRVFTQFLSSRDEGTFTFDIVGSQGSMTLRELIDRIWPEGEEETIN